MICDRCGTTVPDNAQTCHNCGHSFQKSGGRSQRQGTLVLRRQRRAKTVHNLPYKVGDWIDDRYQIKDVLGTGALGGVFRVVDTDMDQELALKLISPNVLTPETIRALRQAMRRVKRLSHPNIVRIYDEGVFEDTFYYTMPFLEGLSLSKIIGLRREKEQYFNLQEVEPILSQVVDALEYAHTTLHHGYLKPHNIIVLPDVLKITEYGIALALPPNVLLDAQKNQTDAVVYFAPELREGRPCDGRADIYSLGIILGEMLTCRSNPEQIPSIQELNPEVNPLIDVVYRRATAYYAEDRYMHIADMMADIVQIIETGELSEDDEVPTLIVGDEHALDLGGMDFGDSNAELGMNSVSMDPDVQGMRDLTPPPLPASVGPDLSPPPLPREESVVIEMSASMEVPALEWNDEQVDYANSIREKQGGFADDHVTIPAEAQLTQQPEGRPVVQFTGESETFRFPSDSENAAPANLQPPPIPGQAIGETNPESPPQPGPGASPFGAVPVNSYGSELELPMDDEETSPSSPIPHLGGPVSGMVDHYPESAPTMPAQMAPERTVPVEQTYTPPAIGVPQPSIPQPMFPPPVPVEQPPPLPAGAHLQEHVVEEETGFSKFGIFFFALGLFLIFGAGGVAVFLKFVYFPRSQMQQLKKEQNLPRLPNVRPAGTNKASVVRPAPTNNNNVVPAVRRDTTPDVRQPERRVPPERRVETRKPPKPKARKRRPKPPPRRRKKKQIVQRKRPPKRRKKRRRVAKAKVVKAPSRKGKCPRGMAYLRGGGFRLGSAKNDEMRSFGERPLVFRRTKAYCIDRFEYPGAGRRPRTRVSFYTAKKLCEKKGKRLCTELEWERACKGGRNYRYPYGNKFSPNKCNTRNSSGANRSVTGSGRFRGCRSRYGIFDMSGNAAEWTSSRYRGSSSSRTVRGGAANRPDWDVRCASRRSMSPSSSKSTVGFRCCADPNE
ncbi:MAG: hypothetical protein EP343_10400 [Deltaproteobacteria bacterium]|nr:MAG: hypothetical protein EP343_10400 [Deltaproteobacteria bacterium]